MKVLSAEKVFVYCRMLNLYKAYFVNRTWYENPAGLVGANQPQNGCIERFFVRNQWGKCSLSTRRDGNLSGDRHGSKQVQLTFSLCHLRMNEHTDWIKYCVLSADVFPLSSVTCDCSSSCSCWRRFCIYAKLAVGSLIPGRKWKAVSTYPRWCVVPGGRVPQI